MGIEFKVAIPGHSQSLTLTKKDVEVLLAAREENWAILARRLRVSAENLSRFVNGREKFPILRKKFIEEIARMIVEQQRKKRSVLAMVV